MQPQPAPSTPIQRASAVCSGALPAPPDDAPRTRSYLAGSFGRVPMAVYISDALGPQELRLYELLCIVAHEQRFVFRTLAELARWAQLDLAAADEALEGLLELGLVARADDHLLLEPVTPITLGALPTPATLQLLAEEAPEADEGAFALTPLAVALDARLTLGQRRLLGWYRAVAGPDGVSWWSTRKIAAHLGYVRETISRLRGSLGELKLIESVQDRPYRVAATCVLAPAPVDVADLTRPVLSDPDAARITQEPDPEPNHEPEKNTRVAPTNSPAPDHLPDNTTPKPLLVNRFEGLFPDHPDTNLEAAQTALQRRLLDGEDLEGLLDKARSYASYASYFLPLQVWLDKVADRWVVPTLSPLAAAKKSRRSRPPRNTWSHLPDNPAVEPTAPTDEPSTPEGRQAIAALLDGVTADRLLDALPADRLLDALPAVFEHIRADDTPGGYEDTVEVLVALVASWWPEACADEPTFRREVEQEFRERFSTWVFEVECKAAASPVGAPPLPVLRGDQHTAQSHPPQSSRRGPDRAR